MSRRAKRKYCCVFGCLKNDLTNPELSFFSIPKEKDRRIQWLRLIDREDLLDKNIYHRVCEVHFRVNDILVRKRRKMLKKNCTPCMEMPNAVVTDPRPDKQTQFNITTVDSSSQIETERTAAVDTLKESEEIMAKDMFYKLCDHFLSKNLAELIKSQTYLKSSNKGPSTSAIDASRQPSTSGQSIYINDIKPDTSYDMSNNYSLHITIDEDESEPELDVYDEFALSLAKTFKSINNVAGRRQLMSASRSMVENFRANGDLPHASQSSQQAVDVPTTAVMQQGSLQPQTLLFNQTIRKVEQSAAPVTKDSSDLIKTELTWSNESNVAQSEHVQRKAIDVLASSTQTQERKEYKIPTKRGSFSSEPDPAATQRLGETKLLTDTPEIKQENVHNDESSSISTSLSTATALSASRRGPAPSSSITFVHDSIPIKLKLVDDMDD